MAIRLLIVLFLCVGCSQPVNYKPKKLDDYKAKQVDRWRKFERWKYMNGMYPYNDRSKR